MLEIIDQFQSRTILLQLFEPLVLKSILPFVNTVLMDEQYGFRPQWSATLNLIAFSNFVLDVVEQGSLVGFTKAFDRVDHSHM